MGQSKLPTTCTRAGCFTTSKKAKRNLPRDGWSRKTDGWWCPLCSEAREAEERAKRAEQVRRHRPRREANARARSTLGLLFAMASVGAINPTKRQREQ